MFSGRTAVVLTPRYGPFPFPFQLEFSGCSLRNQAHGVLSESSPSPWTYFDSLILPEESDQEPQY